MVFPPPIRAQHKKIQLSHEVVRVVPCKVGWCRAVVVVVLCWWVQADTTLSVASTLLAGGRSEVAGGLVGGRLVQYSANTGGLNVAAIRPYTG